MYGIRVFLLLLLLLFFCGRRMVKRAAKLCELLLSIIYNVNINDTKKYEIFFSPVVYAYKIYRERAICTQNIYIHISIQYGIVYKYVCKYAGVMVRKKEKQKCANNIE